MYSLDYALSWTFRGSYTIQKLHKLVNNVDSQPQVLVFLAKDNIIPTFPYIPNSKRVNHIPWGLSKNIAGPNLPINIQPILQISQPKALICQLNSQLNPNSLRPRTVSKCVRYCFWFSLTNGTKVILNHTSSHKAMLHPNTFMSTFPQKGFNSRQSFSLPYPIGRKGLVGASTHCNIIGTLQIKVAFWIVHPCQSITSSICH